MSKSALSLRRDPFRLLFSRAPWASAWYLLSYLLAGTVAFAVTVASVATAGALSITVAGLPLLIAAAAVVRGFAAAERWRLGGVLTEPAHGGYRQATRTGLLARLRTQWTDPATWRDLAYLVALFVPLFALDLTALVVWLVLLAGITLPAWYHYPVSTWTVGVSDRHVTSAHGIQLGYFPQGPHGHGAWGLYVDTLPKALIVALACLVLFLLFNYVVIAAARLHAAIARALLRAPQDPLRAAKEVLLRPGPLSGAPRNI
jgi:hypothetical protein